jgi:hypothetical protein
MQDQRAGIEADGQVFRASADTAHGLILHRRFEIGLDGPAQAPFADDGFEDSAIEQSGRDAAPGRFYFGKLGQRDALDYLIFDSL